MPDVRPRIVATVVGVTAVVLVAVGMLGASVLLLETTPSSVAPPRDEGTVAVFSETYDGAREISATPQVGEAQLLRSAESGTVTRSACAVGAAMSSGSSPLTVDDRPVLALATAIPMWRDLSSGVKGDDVAAVQTELTRLGHDVRATAVYDAATRAAVRELWSSVGVSRPDGGLAVASVIWLPEPETKLASCSVQTGEPITAGQEIGEVAGALQSLTLTNPPGEGWVASYGENSAAVDASGRVTDPAFLAAVEAGHELRLAIAPNGPGVIALEVALAEPHEVLVVPPSAVAVTGAGTGCLVAQGRGVPVSIVSSALGQTLVEVTNGDTPSRVNLRPDESVRCP